MVTGLGLHRRDARCYCFVILVCCCVVYEIDLGGKGYLGIWGRPRVNPGLCGLGFSF